MEMLTGRLTANAIVKTVSDGKEVVNFSIAVNDRYKTKGGEAKVKTRYFRCSYWNTSGIARYLKKGGLLELAGRINIEVWNDKDGNARGALTMRVTNIQLLGGIKSLDSMSEPVKQQTEKTEDLPF